MPPKKTKKHPARFIIVMITFLEICYIVLCGKQLILNWVTFKIYNVSISSESAFGHKSKPLSAKDE